MINRVVGQEAPHIEPKTICSMNFGEEIRMREGTKLDCWAINIVFNEGGMGDFVNYAAATVWLARNCPWVTGRLFVPKYLLKLMQIIHKPFTHWSVKPSEEMDFEDRTPIFCQGLVIKGIRVGAQYLNCLGAHPFDVGFAYYTGTTPPPPDTYLPQIDFHKDLLAGLSYQGLKDEKYVVFPVGNQSPARLVTGKHLNPVIEHVVSRGLTPVFVGKKDPILTGANPIKFQEDINYSLGIDLRDQTDVIQLAAIMQHSVCTVGLDCGPLHLAALTKDSRIIFAYNITTVAHREPKRLGGKTINIALTEDELICSGCQSKLKQIAKVKFDRCLYGDTKCVDMLFDNGGKRFTDAIDEMIGFQTLS